MMQKQARLTLETGQYEGPVKRLPPAPPWDGPSTVLALIESFLARVMSGGRGNGFTRGPAVTRVPEAGFGRIDGVGAIGVLLPCRLGESVNDIPEKCRCDQSYHVSARSDCDPDHTGRVTSQSHIARIARGTETARRCRLRGAALSEPTFARFRAVSGKDHASGRLEQGKSPSPRAKGDRSWRSTAPQR